MKKSIDNNGVRIAYKTDGDSAKPALVMLHGFGNNSQNWYDLGYIDILKQHFYCVMLDVRGFGKSDKPLSEDEYSLETIATDVLAVMKNENLKTATLYGSSVGALEAGYLATHYQEYFDTFVFQGTSPFNVINLKNLLKDILAKTKADGIVAYVDELERMFNSTFPAHIRTAMEMCDADALYAVASATWPDQVDKFPNITKPCLIIIGEHEGITEDMQKAAELIPNCQLEILSGLDHAHAYWAGDRVAPLIIDFVEGVIDA